MKLEEMRVQDLPEILQSMIKRLGSGLVTLQDVQAKYYLLWIDWTKATDQERLAYCELRYPIGTKCKALDFVKSEKQFLVQTKPYIYHANSIAGKFLNGVLYNDGIFAKIILPEEKPVESITDSENLGRLIKIINGGRGCYCANGKEGVIVSRDEAMKNVTNYAGEHRDEIAELYIKGKDIYYGLCEGYEIEYISKSVEFKEGEMVEHRSVNSEWKSEGAIFTGGHNSKGNPIVEINGELYVVKYIRKLDPDRGIKALADEVMSGFVFGAYEGGLPIVELTKDSFKNALVEIAKKVKEAES